MSSSRLILFLTPLISEGQKLTKVTFLIGKCIKKAALWSSLTVCWRHNTHFYQSDTQSPPPPPPQQPSRCRNSWLNAPGAHRLLSFRNNPSPSLPLLLPTGVREILTFQVTVQKRVALHYLDSWVVCHIIVLCKLKHFLFYLILYFILPKL